MKHLRIGGDNASLTGDGDGRSDVFVATLADDHGHTVRTSTAVQNIATVVDVDGSVAA